MVFAEFDGSFGERPRLREGDKLKNLLHVARPQQDGIQCIIVLAWCGTSFWIALKIASIGPLPVDCTVLSRPSIDSVRVACCGPWVPAITVKATSLMRSAKVAISSSTSASMSSS